MIDADVPGVLVLHHHPPGPQPPDLSESVRAFGRLSRHACWQVNAALGVPPGLREGLRFRAVILHYSVFYAGLAPVLPFQEVLARHRDRYVVALLQDEQSDLPQRLALAREAAVDSVYSCLEAADARAVYGALGADVSTFLPGYVSDRLRAAARRFARCDERRRIDIGYRGRRPPPGWGDTAEAKWEIARRVAAHERARGLSLDVETAERRRIYGDRWYRFLGDCRATLGAESGATIPAQPATGGRPVDCRTIGPRHLEAAALGTAQVLVEGRYSGLLEPGVHYVPVRADFSDLGEAIDEARDPRRRAALAARARADLVDSGELDYRRFVARVDAEIAAACGPLPAPADRRGVDARLYPPLARRRARRAVLRTRSALGGQLRRSERASAWLDARREAV